MHEWNECTADYENCTGILCTRESRRAMFTTRVLMCGFDCDLNGPDCVARVRLLVNEIIYPVYCCMFALSVNIVSLSGVAGG